jgi:hypothetical protein
MKFLSVLLLVVFGFSSAWAETSVETSADTSRVTYENGTGRGFDNCRTPFAFCIDRVKREAEQKASYDAENRCRMNRGRSSGGASCNSYCSPSLIPPNSPPTFVTCDARCSLRCEIQD